MFVAPSPKNATATRGSERSLKASAAPTMPGQPAADDRVRAQVAALEVVEVHGAAVAVAAALDLAVELGHDLVRMRALGDRVAVRAVGRRDHVALLERAARAHRDRLLADGDVEEAGQLAGAEALLDLLLESPDEEHLPKEVLQALGRHCLPLFLEGCHGADKLAVRVNNLRPDGPCRSRRRARPRTPPRLGARAHRADAGRGGRRRPRGAAARLRLPGARGQIVHASISPPPTTRLGHAAGPGPARPRAPRPGRDPGPRAPRRVRASGPDGRRSRAGSGGAHDARGLLGLAPAAACRRTGATSTPRSSSTRATTSTAARSCSPRSTPPAPAGPRASASAPPTGRATASPPAWPDAPSSASTTRA